MGEVLNLVQVRLAKKYWLIALRHRMKPLARSVLLLDNVVNALEGDSKNNSFDTGKFSVISLLPGTGQRFAIRLIGLLSVC